MRLLIHDANVLIDLLDIGLLEEAMTLPYVMETTDLIKHEVVDVEQAHALSECISKRLLVVLSSSIEEMLKIAEMQNASPQLTLADCSVVFHAQNRDGVVLSGDGRLRKEAERQKLEVHSTPWLLSLLVDEGSMAPATAVERLELLMDINRRLPQRECRKLIDAWKHMAGSPSL
jgi:predicted nucleic acid-binding protein